MSNISEKWGSWKNEPPRIDEKEIAETLDCDVAVAGAGIAGVTCALRAAQNGLSVIVSEKTGHWNARGGNIGVANSKYMKSLGMENDLDVLAREWIKRCCSRCDEEVLWRYLKNSENAMDWLLDIVTAPEYGVRPEMQASMYRGETYAERYGSHRFFDGPMAKKGMRPGASDCVYAMYTESLKLGVRYLFDSPAVQLDKKDGRVCSLVAKTENGYVRVNAKKGVVLATGDIGANKEMCEDLAPLAASCKTNTYMPKGANTGDGHRLGLWAGGAFEEGAFPVMLHPQAYSYVNYCFLFVDEKGKRFMNEDSHCQAKCVYIKRRGADFAWSIIDGAWKEKIPATLPYGGGMFWGLDHGPDAPGFTVAGTERLMNMARNGGNLVEADTPEELAAKMGVPKDEFIKTLDRYNRMCKNGKDDQFGKRKELMIPLDTPPYFAFRFGPAVLVVAGGLKVDADMNVLDENNDPVPGLYAVGNTAGGRFGVDYPMVLPGTSHGTALTLGYVLGEILAGKEVL